MMTKNRVKGRLIETDAFPTAFLSQLAERESWRKEVHRPIYHVHKWWAKRLGSVFRGILLGCSLPEGEDLTEAFYQYHTYSELSVFDPFMGSGTTIGEAHKLGFTALGRDINPVACEGARIAFVRLDRQRLQTAFDHLSQTVGEKIRALYKSDDSAGNVCDVLYLFWVMTAPCLNCGSTIDLFSSRIFARNAYPSRKPEIQVCCPGCGEVFSAINSDSRVGCPSCKLSFNPHSGCVDGKDARCTNCSVSFTISQAIQKAEKPPQHRLYAKLLLTPFGEKQYLRASAEDVKAYKDCVRLLEKEERTSNIRLPRLELSDGHNTRQAMNYNYCRWRDFFNDRQLLALGWLQKAICNLTDASVRDALLTLFSGTLEFNNLFASYKGEGTGAVRHMFSHHILKPERTPIEANVWGTPKSSGSFTNLYKTRLLRALAYQDMPVELTTNSEKKTVCCSKPFAGNVYTSWSSRKKLQPGSIYISCGSSHKVSLPNQSVDFIVTDPPFFDNVHYSELADFFYAWQQLHPRGFLNGASSTRHGDEVQDKDANAFAVKLLAVFRECHRVLKNEGLLVFTYHHSREEGWVSLARAIYGAGFSIVNAHPVKSEMSVAAPKTQAKEPIQIDVILVCRKQDQDNRRVLSPEEALPRAIEATRRKLGALTSVGLQLSLNDVRVTMYSNFLASLGATKDHELVCSAMKVQSAALHTAVESWRRQERIVKQNGVLTGQRCELRKRISERKYEYV